MKKNNRCLAIILCIFLFFSLIITTSFIVGETEHECVGGECEICAQISSCQDSLKKIALVKPLLLILAIVFVLVKSIVLFSDVFNKATPFALKVKLLN